jgi:hypothetical protein
VENASVPVQLPPLSPRELPAEAKALRDLAADEFAKRHARLQPSVNAHIAAYSKAVERLIEGHGNIATRTDLPIGTETRESALWELSGRCLGECRLLIHALRGGFALEASSNVRAVFEAMYLLGAVQYDDDILRRWLAGDYVPPRHARAVMVKRETLARDSRVAGSQQSGRSQGSFAENGRWLYSHFSKSAHHRRGPITASVSLDRREFAYGPHPDPAVRAREVDHAGEMVETALMVVAAALAHLVGPEGLTDVLMMQAEEFERVRDSDPLT